MQLGPLFIGWTPLSEADRIAFGLDAWAPVGPLFIGWTPLSEADRIAFGLDAWAPGWEVFSVEWNGIGFTFCARPKEARNGN